MAALLITMQRAWERINPFIRPRKVQELADLGLACICTTTRHHRRQGLKLDVDAICDEVAALSFHAIKDRLQGDINEQVVDVANIVAGCVRGAQLPPDPALANEASMQAIASSAGVPLSYWDTTTGTHMKSLLRQELRAALGYCTTLKPSSIPGAGLGLWVEGTAPTGSIVGIFSGLVYAPQYVRRPEYQAELFPDADMQLVLRYDNCVIDGRRGGECAWHPLGAAAMANHPPKGRLPNVMQVAYDFPGGTGKSTPQTARATYPAELRDYVPNAYRTRPTIFGGKLDDSVLVESMVLVATTDLEDQEVFMNYRLTPSGAGPLPAWYTPVSAEEDERRWEGVIKKV